MDYSYKLIPQGNGYDLIIQLSSSDSEFALDFFSKNRKASKNRYSEIYQSIKKEHPNLLINTVKVMVGGILLSTIPFSVLKAKASEQSSQTIQEQTSYTVGPGDSLWTVAQNFGISVSQLRSVNNLTSDTLQIGQTLQIPRATTLVNPAPAITPKTYTVKLGDSLSTIAKAHGVSIDTLRITNNIKRDILYVGQSLTIPSVMNQTEIKPVLSVPITYTVKSGDSLSVIAARYNTTTAIIRDVNKLTSNTIRIGQVLTIPQTQGNTTVQTPSTPIVQPTPIESIVTIQPTSYTVKAGDSLSVIASRFNTTTSKLKEIKPNI